MKNPSCFISYSRKDPNHIAWVRKLSERLQQSGVVTHFDDWELLPGMDLGHWMESTIADSDYIILVCTPDFVAKANSRDGGVGNEQLIISKERYHKLRPQTNFIPILREGTAPPLSIPRYLGNAKWLDFRSGVSFDASMEELLRHIYDSPEYERPPLGKAPDFKKAPDETTANNDESPDVIQFIDIAKRWESSNKPYYMVEGLSKEAVAFVRHPPTSLKKIDEPMRSFLLLAGLHHGGNWIHWLQLNLNDGDILPIILTALSISYERVKFRALYCMQFADISSFHSKIEDGSISLSKELKDIIDKYVISKSVRKYIEELIQAKDYTRKDKAGAVLNEIDKFSTQN